MQANEVLKLVTGIGKPIINQILIYNSLENSQYKMVLKNSFKKGKIRQLFETDTYFDAACEVQEQSLLISAKALRQKLSFGEASQKLHIISVIEDTTIKHPFQVHQKIPLSKLDPMKQHYRSDNEYVIVCNKGISSYIATKKIKASYPDLNILSLKNGIINY
jgi:adenylyltransferase/sulfurtransferase